MNHEFRYYVHDGPDALSFELAGDLTDPAALELEQSGRMALSGGGARSMIVDLSYVHDVEPAGRALLGRWYKQGAQFVAKSARARTIAGSITGQDAAAIFAQAPRRTWRALHWAVAWAIVWGAVLGSAPAFGAELKSETVQSWDEYIKEANARNQKYLDPEKCFLLIDEIPGEAAKVHAGEVFVSPADPAIPRKVPSGLIHDWVGAIFIPNATLPEVLHVVRDYERYKDVYHPSVLESKTTERTEQGDRFSLRLRNKSVVSHTALDTDYVSTFTAIGDRRWISASEAIRIREIAGYEGRSPRVLPEDQGSGLIWRLRSTARFEERDGGVYVELEAIALSRDIPAALRWVVEPIVRRISRSSLETSLEQTAAAVMSDANGASRPNARAGGPAGDHAGCARGSCIADFPALSASGSPR